MTNYESVSVRRLDGERTERFRNAIRLRWRYAKVPFSLTVGKFSKSTMKEAKHLATIIRTDIANGKFDFSLEKYAALLKKNQVVMVEKSKLQVNKKAPGSTARTFFQAWMKTLKPVPFNVESTHRMIERWGPITFADVPKKLDKEKLAAVTFNNRINILRRFFKWLMKKKTIKSNPIEDVEKQKDRNKIKRTQRTPFDDDEIKSILKAFKTNRFSRSTTYPHSTYYPFVKFIFSTGVRNAEAIGLLVKKVNFKKKYVTIDLAFAKTRKGSHVKARVLKPTKTGNSRNLPLTPELASLLKPLCKHKSPEDFVFVNTRGNAIDDRMFQKRIFKPVLRKLCIEERDLYAIRHTFGTVAMEQNINPLDAAYLMGHTTTRTMIESYLHLRRVPDRMPKIG